jgi:hypothetical protein|tara:strand:+ start:13277 stop:13693 length:417 start_codon:yes stop_codon:yes gene_type:complete
VNITHLEISSFVNATEDSASVLKCIKNILPFNCKVEIEKFVGHFGNPIIKLKCKTVLQIQIIKFIESMTNSLSQADITNLTDNLNSRLDGNKLYLRFDKTAAFQGRLTLGEGMQVVLTITSYPFNKKKIINEFKDLLL